MSLIPTRKKLVSLNYSSWVVKQINLFLTCNNFPRQCKLLQELNSYLTADVFLYRSKEAEITCKRCFLTLWMFLLENVDTIPYPKRSLFYTIILSLIKRYEFDMIHFESSKLDIGNHGIDLDVMKQYHLNLMRTQTYVFHLLSQALVLKIQRQFCIQVMSITYFRLPMLTSIMLNGTCKEVTGLKLVPSLPCITSPDCRTAFHSNIFSIRSPPPKVSKKETDFSINATPVSRSSINTTSTNIQMSPSMSVPNSDISDALSMSPSSSPYPSLLFHLKNEVNLPYPGNPNPPPRKKRINNVWFDSLLKDFDLFIANQKQADTAAVSTSRWFLQHNPSLFQWHLMENLSIQIESPSNLMELAEHTVPILNDDEFFHDFIALLLSHVCEVTHGEVRWSLVPGFWTICIAMLKRLKIMFQSLTALFVAVPTYDPDTMIPIITPSIPVAPPSVWESMKRCSSILISCNHEMLNYFCRISISSTNALDKDGVNTTINLLDAWFYSISPDLSYPLSLDFDLLLNFLTTLLDSQHFQILLKTLCFLYTHVGRFPNRLRSNLFFDCLFDKYFYKLFLHWCPEVRKQFHHILIYRMNRQGIRSGDSEISSRASITKSIKGHLTVSEPKTTDSDQSGSIFSYVTSAVSSLIWSPISKLALGDSSSEPSDSDLISNSVISLESGDPSLDTCTIVTSSNLDEEGRTIDSMLVNRLNVFVHMVDEQLRHPEMNYFNSRLAIYAPASISELELLRGQFHRIQRATPSRLKIGQVVIPCLSFQIIKQNDSDGANSTVNANSSEFDLNSSSTDTI